MKTLSKRRFVHKDGTQRIFVEVAPDTDSSKIRIVSFTSRPNEFVEIWAFQTPESGAMAINQTFANPDWTHQGTEDFTAWDDAPEQI